VLIVRKFIFRGLRAKFIDDQHLNMTTPYLIFNVSTKTHLNFKLVTKDLTRADTCKKARSGSSLPTRAVILR
jgi:hypothetical protein